MMVISVVMGPRKDSADAVGAVAVAVAVAVVAVASVDSFSSVGTGVGTVGVSAVAVAVVIAVVVAVSVAVLRFFRGVTPSFLPAFDPALAPPDVGFSVSTCESSFATSLSSFSTVGKPTARMPVFEEDEDEDEDEDEIAQGGASTISAAAGSSRRFLTSAKDRVLMGPDTF